MHPKIYSSVLGTIGNTPVVQLNNICNKDQLKCRLLAKCEFMNPGGSVKDRIAVAMIEAAEREGKLVPGVTTIIEPTSGNTGATVIRTPTDVPHDHPESHISNATTGEIQLDVAKKLHQQTPGSVMLDQYSNPENPKAHEHCTADEILEITDNGKDLHAIVMGAGTGGTLSGVGKRIKTVAPHVKIIGVDPEGSVLSGKGQDVKKGQYQVEGIGYDFIPDVLDLSIADEWIRVSDEESFSAARRLIMEEGLLCGGSSGSALQATLSIAEKFEGKTILLILPDCARNYTTKFISNEWMVVQGLSHQEGSSTFQRKDARRFTSLSKEAPVFSVLRHFLESPEVPAVMIHGSILTKGSLVRAVVGDPSWKTQDTTTIEELEKACPSLYEGSLPQIAEDDPVEKFSRFPGDTPLALLVGKNGDQLGYISARDVMLKILSEIQPRKIK